MIELVMPIQDNWLANLKALVDELAPGPNTRGVKRPAFQAIASRASVNEEYIYQLYNGKGGKVVGLDMAKAIARAFAEGRDPSWFDMLPEDRAISGARATLTAPVPVVSPEELQHERARAELIVYFDQMSIYDRAAVLKDAHERAARQLGDKMLSDKFGVTGYVSDGRLPPVYMEFERRRVAKGGDPQQVDSPLRPKESDKVQKGDVK